MVCYTRLPADKAATPSKGAACSWSDQLTTVWSRLGKPVHVGTRWIH